MKKLLPVIILTGVLFVYLTNLAPTVSFRDSGDMISASYTLGISHPSGFPLFMLLGKLFTYIPFAVIAFRINLMSALAAALSGFFVYLTALKLTKSRMIGLISWFFIAFSPIFWTYAEIGEKYSLLALLASVLIYLGVNLNKKNVIFFAFFLGLSLTHHVSLIVFIIPVCGLIYMTQSKKHLRKNAVKFFIAFLIPLLLYLYIPIRASADPAVSYGHPVSFSQVISHITGKDYRYAMFSTGAVNLRAGHQELHGAIYTDRLHACDHRYNRPVL